MPTTLPFGSEFSPAQIRLPHLLDLAHGHEADWHGFEAAVHDEYFAHYATNETNRRKLANNTKLSMRAYGLIADDDTSLTEVGRTLFNIRDDEERLYEDFARHILLHCSGMTLIQTIRDMRLAGDPVKLPTLRRALIERGFEIARGAKKMSTMRLWLGKAGIVNRRYVIDDKRLNQVLGHDSDEFDVLGDLSPAQRAYLRTLANLDIGPHASNDIERLAASTYGATFDEKNLPKQVLYPLRDAGYITLVRGTSQPGRGARPFQVTATERVEREILGPFLAQLDSQVDVDLRRLLRLSLAEIRSDLDSADRYVRGLALEALAFKLMRIIGLNYVATRLRHQSTGGAEVDLIFESARLVFSRWQIQCKNTASGISLDDVAKEVGLTHLLKSNVVVMVSTGAITAAARRYASSVMQDSHLCIIMIEGMDLNKIEASPAHLLDVLGREARHAMQLKKLDLPET